MWFSGNKLKPWSLKMILPNLAQLEVFDYCQEKENSIALWKASHSSLLTFVQILVLQSFAIRSHNQEEVIISTGTSGSDQISGHIAKCM